MFTVTLHFIREDIEALKSTANHQQIDNVKPYIYLGFPV